MNSKNIRRSRQFNRMVEQCRNVSDWQEYMTRSVLVKIYVDLEWAVEMIVKLQVQERVQEQLDETR